MEPLKEMFNQRFYEGFALEFQKVYKSFNRKKFLNEVTKNIEKLSLNQRLRNTSIVLYNHLPADFVSSVNIMMEVIPNTKKGYTNLVFPDYVSLYGLNHFKKSMEALKYFTQFGSSEFAIREFLKNDFNKTIKVMESWSKDKNYHVRRLASEGSRPRLPWSFKLDEVINTPSATKVILDNLKADEELYVRKSVANHLNDISKENADYMLDFISSWDISNQKTSWIIKHACRTLIKKGNSKTLLIFNYEKKPKISLENFTWNTSNVRLGETLSFQFDVVSKKNNRQKLVIDYIIHYKKATKEFSAKVFKLKDIVLAPKQRVSISKTQVFKDFSTRKHVSGTHILEIQINGDSFCRQYFEVLT